VEEETILDVFSIAMRHLFRRHCSALLKTTTRHSVRAFYFKILLTLKKPEGGSKDPPLFLADTIIDRRVSRSPSRVIITPILYFL
jgi:hypothetical protein